MMAVMNIGAILEYGKAGGMVRRFGGLGTKEGASTVGGTVVMAKPPVFANF